MMRSFWQNLRKRYKITREMPQLWRFPKQGFAYIQIPKAATRSIREALLAVEDQQGMDPEQFPLFEAQFSEHVARQQLRQSTEGLKTFAFVRDPYARLYSAYVNKIVDAERRGGKNIFRCHGMSFGMPFDDFVRRTCALDDHHIDRHLRSQAWFLTDKQGLIPDFIGHLETFAEDWQQLREAIPALGDIGHRNRAAGDVDFRSYYSEQSLQLVKRRYAKDFELFGYKPD